MLLREKLRQKENEETKNVFFADLLEKSIMPEVVDYLRNVINLPYTIHDFRHSEKLERLCCELLPESFLDNLSIQEYYFLILSLWLHDGGMVPDSDRKTITQIRDNHHIAIFQRIREGKAIPFLANLDPTQREILAILCHSHRLSIIDNIEKTFLIDLKFVRLRLLSAILRLCDICDVSSSRTPWYIYQNFKFGKESETHWIKHLLIDGLSSESINGTTKFVIQGRYRNEREKKYIFQVAESIENELKILDPVFKENQLFIESKIECKYLENDPNGEENITVLPEKISELLFEHIYESKNVYIRELIQNAIDACKIKNKWSESRGIKYNPSIQITFFKSSDQKSYILKISDNGIGMNQSDVKDFLLDIGKCNCESEEVKNILNSGKIPEHLIAKFGIGFYSCLKVSEKIIIKTQKNGFFGLRVEFPDYSKNYQTISQEKVQLRKEDLTKTGTVVAIYLNEIGRAISIPDAIKQYIRNVNYPICYSEDSFNEEKLWQIHDHSKSCSIIKKQFLGQNADDKFKIRVCYNDELDFEACLAYIPNNNDKQCYVCQEGIFIEDCTELIPNTLFVGISAEINLKANVIDLTAPRNRIIRNEKFNSLKDRLKNHFNKLFSKILKNKPIEPSYLYGSISDPKIKSINQTYKNLKNNKEELKNFLSNIEKDVKVLWCNKNNRPHSLFEIREMLENNHKKVVFNLIEHPYTYLLISAGKVDGYLIRLVPKMNREKGKILSESNDISFTSFHISKHEKEELYEDKYLERGFYETYFNCFNINIRQYEPTEIQTFISRISNDELNKKSKLIQSLLNNNNIKYFSQNVSLRCIKNDTSDCFINISHPRIEELLKKYQSISEKNKLTDEINILMVIYFNLISFQYSESIEQLEKFLINNLTSLENSDFNRFFKSK